MSCACMGPQRGEPLCPCRMAEARQYLGCDTGHYEIERLKAELDEAREIIEPLTLHATFGLAPHYSGSTDRAEQDPLIVRARAFIDKAGK